MSKKDAFQLFPDNLANFQSKLMILVQEPVKFGRIGPSSKTLEGTLPFTSFISIYFKAEQT